MISRKCPLLLWLVIAMHLLSTHSSQDNRGVGDLMFHSNSRHNKTLLIPQRKRTVRQNGEPDPCEQFEVPDEVNQEFFSPGFNRGNENYTSNADCVLRLKAPQGQIIQLDFRDYFQIEQSPDCHHDYLEVLDGAEGYNRPSRSPICGFDFPEPITSTDRYLWLRFKSDENIEYKGFKGVYEFKDRPKNATQVESMECKTNLTDMEQGEFKRDDIDPEYKEYTTKNDMPYDCVWNITVKENWRIQLQFEKFSLEKPNECTVNFIQIFYDKTDKDHLLQEFCGSIAEPVNSKGNVMFVRFFAENKVPKSTFKANFTAFRPIDKNSNDNNQGCDAGEFNCEDATCISESLRCNQKINCRFRWDEEGCDSAESIDFKNDHIIIIMVVFSLILSGMCFTFVFNCIKKLIRDHRTIQEYIRQSREQQLNELDKPDNGDKNASKSLTRSRSNSRSPSTDSPHFGTTNSATTPCYVPGGEVLPILIRKEHSMSPSNGDAYNQNIYTVDNEIGPEMCDSACQTRESLFTTQGYSSGNSTPNRSVHTNSPPAPFSTFGYKKDNKFKAEAKIEVTTGTNDNKKKNDGKRRPYSVQTTKSAPDVIVTH